MSNQVGIRLKSKEILLGDKRGALESKLNTDKIRYIIQFDKNTTNGRVETLIELPDYLVDITLVNGVVNYIRSDDNEYTHLDKIDIYNYNELEHVNIVRQKLQERFGSNYTLKVEKIDTSAMSLTVIISNSDLKVRLITKRDSHGNIFINTMTSVV